MQPLTIIRGVARITAASAFVWLFFFVTYALAAMSTQTPPSLFKYLLCITPAAIVALSGFDDLASVFGNQLFRNQLFPSKLIFYLGMLAAIAALLYLDWPAAHPRLIKIAAPVLAIFIAAIAVRASKPLTNIINMVAGLVSASLLFFALTYEGHFATHAISVAVFTLAACGLLAAILTAAQRDQPAQRIDPPKQINPTP